MAKQSWITQYGVFLGLDVINACSGKVIDYHGENEWYDTYEQARNAAEKYQQQIGEEFCSWVTM
jgi:hypothetical protein